MVTPPAFDFARLAVFDLLEFFHGIILAHLSKDRSTHFARAHKTALWAISVKSRSRKSAQCDKWSFCLTAGTLWPANQERP